MVLLNSLKNINKFFYSINLNIYVLIFFFFGLIGTGTLKTVEHVVQIGENLQKILKHTEQTNPISISSRWQKHAAR